MFAYIGSGKQQEAVVRANVALLVLKLDVYW
jgi:hypothetical protein